MNIYKEEKGVTLIALAVTIVIMLILAGVGIYEGSRGVDSANDSNLMSEAKMVQHAVLEQYTKYKTTQNKDYLIGSRMDRTFVTQVAAQIGVSLVNIPSTYTNADYYKLTKTDMEKLGFENVEDEYIINYVSGEVINYTQRVDSKGNALYVKGDSFTGE